MFNSDIEQIFAKGFMKHSTALRPHLIKTEATIDG